MIKTKKQMFTIIGAFVLVMMLMTVTYAFFNYTRTGVSNVIKTGRIYFNAEQGDTVTLSDLFPISMEASEEVTSETPGVGSLTIHVTGDTMYDKGIEYLVKAVDVTNSTNGVDLPISIAIKYEEANGKTIGMEDEEYFDNRGGNSSLYKVLSTDSITDDGDLVVGYITPGQAGIDGTITIMAYLDANNIAISDTYDEASPETDFNGTTTNWVDGRTVLTTREWNDLQSTGVSFKIKVEANEGTWVNPIYSVNVMNKIPTDVYTYDISSNVNKIIFDRMRKIEMQNAYDAAAIKADLTYNNEGKVLSWLELDPIDNTKYNMYIVSNGETYLTTGNDLFYAPYLVNVNSIDFNNVNTSRVTDMSRFLYNLNNIEEVDLTSFDTSNVVVIRDFIRFCPNLRVVNMQGLDLRKAQNMERMFQANDLLEEINLNDVKTRDVVTMYNMFYNSNNIEEINLEGFGGDNLTNITTMFSRSSKIKEINMKNFNFGKIENINSLFSDLSKLENVDISNSKGLSLTEMRSLFSGCTSLKTIDLSNMQTANITTIDSIFYNCSSLTSIDLSTFDTSSLSIGGLNSAFDGCSSLNTIYVSASWSITNQINPTPVFNGCTSLVGGNGTLYDESHIDKEYARIDGGQDNPGYLTLKTN